jgi:hypothetical protein
MTTAPTCEQLLDEDGVKSVKRETESGWRHGVEHCETFHRPADNTYWQVNYRVSTDGETHELRDGGVPIVQVEPVESTVILYRHVKAA